MQNAICNVCKKKSGIVNVLLQEAFRLSKRRMNSSHGWSYYAYFSQQQTNGEMWLLPPVTLETPRSFDGLQFQVSQKSGQVLEGMNSGIFYEALKANALHRHRCLLLVSLHVAFLSVVVCFCVNCCLI